VRAPGEDGPVLREPGWREYRIEVTNAGAAPLTVSDVKLLTGEGRYLASAASYEELRTHPGAGEVLAKDIARRSAGIAAGQAIPYGGTLVGILSGAFSASAAGSQAEAKRVFLLRRLKSVELAPGGRIAGSAFFPDVTDARALIIDFLVAGRPERAEIPLAKDG
jgi:hypothetical protein